MRLWLATAVSAIAVLQVGAAGAGGPKGRKAGVRRMSEFRSGNVVVGQIVDLAPDFGRVASGGARMGRDQHGRAMELDDSTPGQLRFRNRGADGLRVTHVRTWDGATRRWTDVRNGVVDQEVGKPAPEMRPAAFIRPTVLPASGSVNRPYANGLRSLRLSTIRDRRTGVTALSLELYDLTGEAMNYRLVLPLDDVNSALAFGVPVESGAWTVAASNQSLELRRRDGREEVIRIDRALVDQVWAEASRDFPLAD